MGREIRLSFMAQNLKDLNEFLEFLKESYPSNHFTDPKRNSRPPLMGGYRVTGTIVMEDSTGE